MLTQERLRESCMKATRARFESTCWRARPCAAAGRRGGLANWLALIALLALGIVWQ